MPNKFVGVRLDPAELAALRKVPGENDSARVRALIHNQAIATGLIDQMVVALGPKLEAIAARMIEADKNHARKLGEALEKPLSEILNRLRTGRG